MLKDDLALLKKEWHGFMKKRSITNRINFFYGNNNGNNISCERFD